MSNKFKLNSFNIFLLQTGLHKFVQKDLIDNSQYGVSSIYDVIDESQLEYMELKPGLYTI